MICKQDNIYIYEEINENEIRLLRAYGSYSQVEVPEQLDGKFVTQIGAYCFAEKSRLSGEQEAEVRDFLMEQKLVESVTELAGNYITEVSIPDSVTCLESYAFYNCRELLQLSVGTKLMEVNGDSFMNCRKLKRLVMRGDAGQRTGLSFILNQITAEIEVTFDNGNDQTKLMYPEYTERYEEIGPAHIFQLKVDGEGFRARKQFRDGVVDLEGYDHVFELARIQESVKLLSQMALDRLVYPVELKPKYRIQYEQYLQEHEMEILKLLVKDEDLEQLEFLCDSGFVSQAAIAEAVRLAAMQGWTRGSACMRRGNQQVDAEEEYVF